MTPDEIKDAADKEYAKWVAAGDKSAVELIELLFLYIQALKAKP